MIHITPSRRRRFDFADAAIALGVYAGLIALACWAVK